MEIIEEVSYIDHSYFRNPDEKHSAWLKEKQTFEGRDYERSEYAYGSTQDKALENARNKIKPGFWFNYDDMCPGVMCSCLNYTFQLEYGHYSVQAKCTKCGLKQEIYSG